jgi:hypothetical protein
VKRKERKGKERKGKERKRDGVLGGVLLMEVESLQALLQPPRGRNEGEEEGKGVGRRRTFIPFLWLFLLPVLFIIIIMT